MTNLRKIFLSFLLLSALPAMSNTDHGDHLGSAHWITNADGDAVQYIHYAPGIEFVSGSLTKPVKGARSMGIKKAGLVL